MAGDPVIGPDAEEPELAPAAELARERSVQGRRDAL